MRIRRRETGKAQNGGITASFVIPIIRRPCRSQARCLQTTSDAAGAEVEWKA